jgi:hypothetical protein
VNTVCGDILILENNTVNRRLKIRFLNTGSEKTVHSSTLTRGNLKDDYVPNICGIGYIGSGVFSHKTHPKLYDAWTSMFKRCTDSKNYPAYRGCTVDPAWHCFQNFAKWASDSGWTEGMQIDKDLKNPGNKIYGPESCSIVDRFTNTQEMIARRIPEMVKAYSVIHVATGAVYRGTNRRAFIKEYNLNRNLFHRLESGKSKIAEGYSLYND